MRVTGKNVVHNGTAVDNPQWLWLGGQAFVAHMQGSGFGPQHLLYPIACREHVGDDLVVASCNRGEAQQFMTIAGGALR